MMINSKIEVNQVKLVSSRSSIKRGKVEVEKSKALLSRSLHYVHACPLRLPIKVDLHKEPYSQLLKYLGKTKYIYTESYIIY